MIRIPVELERQLLVVEHDLPGRDQLAEIARTVAIEPGELPGAEGPGDEGAGGKNRRARCQRVLDAGIKSFFDEIDHEAILSRTPVFRRVIEGWLKAGVAN